MEKIGKLKSIFKKEGVGGYVIPKNDEFFAEYIPAYSDRLSFITGFQGSYGLALILKDKNYLFVDGRYTLQANNQSGKFLKLLQFQIKCQVIFLKVKKYQLGLIQIYLQKSLWLFFLEKVNANLNQLRII